MDDPGLPVVLEEETTLPPGTRLGKYQLVRLLGAGGMGAVYEAFHTEIGKRVAVKTLAPAVAAIPGARQRFLREAQLTSRLRHPHIVDLTDMGSEGRIAYLVMELMAGEDLAHRLERMGPMPPRDLVDLMLPVCSALVAAHEAGIVHRDLKPQNIFLAAGHHGTVPKVLDFGISKSSDTDASSSLTGTGSVIGTPHYLAPEQIKDARSASAASDQYSIGVILYRCLADANPFEGESIFAVMQAIVTETPPPLRRRRPDLPEGLERVVARAMNPLPWERFPSVRELGRALLPFASTKARVIWEETFTGGAAPSSEAPRPSLTMPMPTPTPGPARALGAIPTLKARVDSGTLSAAVTTTDTSLGLEATGGSRRRKVIVMAFVGAAIAVGGIVALTRGSSAPAPSPAAAPVAAPAPPPVAPSAAELVAKAQEAEAAREAEAAAEAKRQAEAREASLEASSKEAAAKEAAAAREAAAKTETAASAHRKPSATAHHPTPHAHPGTPAAGPRNLNPNGAPVID